MKKIEIIHTTPSKIVIQCEDKIATISGEALTRIPGQPDFVIYASSLKAWKVGNDILEISLEEQKKIMQEVVGLLSARGWNIEVEK